MYPQTLIDQFQAHVRRRGDAACLILGDWDLSWNEVEAWSELFAQQLHDAYGVGPGRTVGLLLRNSAELVVAFLAVQKLGAIASCLNTRISVDATLQTVRAEDHAVVLIGPSFADSFASALTAGQEVRVMVLGENEPPDVLASVREHGRITSEARPTDLCNIFHTSGTTGFPKGAALTHVTQTISGLQYALEMGVSRKDVGLSAAPMVIGAATNFFVCFTIVVGAPLVLLPEPTPRAVRSSLYRDGVTAMFAVPTQLHAFLSETDPSLGAPAALRIVRTGGSSLTVETIRRIRAEWHAEVVNTYGTTESGTAITTMHTAYDAEEKWATIGKAAYFQEVMVQPVDPDGSEVAERRTTFGQLLNRGPQAIDHYHLRPESPLKDTDGWQSTRDVVEVDDDGYLSIVDRLDNVIVSGGENIYPQAVENVLLESPRVADAAVGSVPDEVWGERVVALIVSADDEDVDVDALRSELGALFESSTAARAHWRPREYRFVDAIPRNILGKIDRTEIRDLVRRLSSPDVSACRRHW